MPYADRPCAYCGKPLPVRNHLRLRRRLAAGLPIFCEEHEHKEARYPTRRLRTRLTPQADRRMGVIVSARTAEGKPLVRHLAGKSWDALSDICAELPEGAYIEAISTWRTIARDLEHTPRKMLGGGHPGRGANPRIAETRVDPWAVERQMLGHVGRLDRLTPAARLPVMPRATLEPRRLARPNLFGRYEQW